MSLISKKDLMTASGLDKFGIFASPAVSAVMKFAKINKKIDVKNKNKVIIIFLYHILSTNLYCLNILDLFRSYLSFL